ncbi:MFS transporter [Sphaerisporangium rubeum]|uniref:Putative MFS family arabinose efflux permease n=1 Tax=Sphaerisporangium rubeum TaxID=321317 RepID=A0A7X0M7B1_9ACTN|nr:MFS transporter [Sphaerisporangium rubeum]MBB6472849.1 putative MFS family arabinose efflux permease [Sphaerisporangium rubeum]
MEPRSPSGPPHVRDEPRRSPWATIAVVYVAGVVSAMSLGKFAPVGPEVQAQLGLTLAQLGWVISAVVGLGAVAGVPAGYLVRRLGTERSLIGGLVLMAVAGGAAVTAGGYAWLLAARFVESAGYLMVTVAAPALILRMAADRDRGVALSIWATFVPVGLGVSTLAGGAAGSALGWRGWTGLIAALTLVMASAVWVRLPRGAARHETAAGPVPRAGALVRPAVLAASFALAVLATLPVVVLLPTLLIESYGRTATTAGALTSAVSLIGVPGGLAVGLLLRKGVSLKVMALSGLLVIPGGWLMYAAGAALPAAVTGAAVISLFNGFLGALVFAALPLVLRRLSDADVGTGLVAQTGSLGALVGPPFFGLVAVGYGYQVLPVVITAGMLAATAALLLATRGVSTRPPR